PLLAYDSEHGTELVRTLGVFLACSGSWTKAADTMFVHVNSLRYRIRRIEELTGRDLGSLEDQAALLLALRLAKDERADPAGRGGRPGRSVPRRIAARRGGPAPGTGARRPAAPRAARPARTPRPAR